MSASPLSIVPQLSRREQAEAEDQAARIACCGLRGRFEHITLSDFRVTRRDQGEVLAAVQEFVKGFSQPGRCAVPHLIGKPGTGKSMLAGGAVHELVHVQRRNVVITTARRIVRRLRGTWAKDSEETEADVLRRLESLDLLVIDEVDIGFGSEAEQVQLLDVIDRRYVFERPTMVISNFNEPLLQAALGERAFDRLQEGATFLRCTWPSHRRAAGESNPAANRGATT